MAGTYPRRAPLVERLTFHNRPAPPGTLRHFYLSTFRATLSEREHIKRYGHSVHSFECFYGGYAPLASITEEQIDAFAETKRPGRCGVSTSKQQSYRVRRIMRAYAPDRFPVRFVRRPGSLWKGPLERHVILPTAPPRGSIREFFETVFLPQRGINYSSVRLADYKTLFTSLFLCHDREPALAELDDAFAARFFQWSLTRGVVARTVNGYRASLFTIWRHAVRQGALSKNPTVPKLREEITEPDAWTADEAARIIAAAGRFAPHKRVSGIPQNHFWQALLLVCWYTALRRRSLLSIRRADVNLETGWILVRPDGMKTRRGKRTRIGRDALDAIRRIWPPSRELLFPWTCTPEHTSKHFRKILKLAGVPRGERLGLCHFHKMRRSTATEIAFKNGIQAASDLLGHSTQETTRRYIDPTRMIENDITRILPSVSGNVDPDGPTAAVSDARDLLRDGRPIPAAMMARVALERIVRASRIRKNVKGNKGLANGLHAMRQRGEISPQELALLKRLLPTANRAAHGLPVAHEQASQLVETVAAFCIQHDEENP